MSRKCYSEISLNFDFCSHKNNIRDFLKPLLFSALFAVRQPSTKFTTHGACELTRNMRFPKFLRVAVGAKKAIVTVDGKPKEIVVYNEIDLKFAQILSKILGFSYQLVTPADGEIGRLLDDGNWTGSVGLIQRNETDLVVSLLSITIPRLEVADFSYTYYRSSIGFATKKPTYSPELSAFLSPFSWEVWTLVLLCFLLMPGIFYLVFRKRYGIQKFALATYCTFFRQSVDVKPRKAREYLLAVFWKLAVGFLGYGYAAVLLSFLSFPPLTGIRTIPELAKAVSAGKCECVGFPGSFAVGILLKSNDADLNVIGSSMQRNEGSMDAYGTLRKAKSKKIAFITGLEFLLPLQTKYFVSEDEFFPAWLSAGIQKGFCCKEALNRAISRVWAYGFYYKFVADEIFLETLRLHLKSSADESDESRERPLTFEEFGGAFVVLVMGYVLSAFVLTLEMVVDRMQTFEKFRKRKHNARLEKFAGLQNLRAPKKKPLIRCKRRHRTKRQLTGALRVTCGREN